METEVNRRGCRRRSSTVDRELKIKNDSSNYRNTRQNIGINRHERDIKLDVQLLFVVNR